MKIALVTGSSRGIGRAIADLLGKNGYWVVYSGTRPQRPEGLPAGASCTHPQGGLFLWVTLPEQIDTTALMPVMAARKVAYLPGVSFFAGRDVRCCLRMNYSNAAEDQIVRGVETMCRVFRDTLAKG